MPKQPKHLKTNRPIPSGLVDISQK